MAFDAGKALAEVLEVLHEPCTLAAVFGALPDEQRDELLELVRAQAVDEGLAWSRVENLGQDAVASAAGWDADDLADVVRGKLVAVVRDQDTADLIRSAAGATPVPAR
jgi:hypothetical protein